MTDIKAILALPEVNGDMNKALAYVTRQLQAKDEELRNAKLGMAGKLTVKVGEKGGVSVYGLGRFPVTLYREQWDRLFAHREQIEGFIKANADKLKAKGDALPAADGKTGTDGK